MSAGDVVSTVGVASAPGTSVATHRGHAWRTSRRGSRDVRRIAPSRTAATAPSDHARASASNVAAARHAPATRAAQATAWTRVLIACLLLLVSSVAGAQTRAWLDRDRIAMGETATLNVETDAASTPDYAPLLRDFDLGGQASQQQLQWTNGQATMRALHAVALRPRRDGLLRIPPLRVGAQVTAPLTLLVTPAAPSAAVSGSGDVFIESEADTQAPYVQQSVGWVVRLYSAIPLIAGNLDQDEPPGASLQRIGDDVQYRRVVNGRGYVVTERRFLLIPERSGELVVPPARFDGRGTGDVFDRLFGDGQNALHAVGRPRVLRVQPIPANAPRPWLPLRALTLRYVDLPQRAKAGSAVDVMVELDADGASASQLPALDLPGGNGTQVFAERAQFDESMADGRPQVHLRRRFQIVPGHAGRLALPGPRVDWWDSRAGVPRSAQLPSIVLQVAPGPAASASATTAHAARGVIPSATAWQHRLPRWAVLVAVVLAALVIMAVALLRRRMIAPAPDTLAAPRAMARPQAVSTPIGSDAAADLADRAAEASPVGTTPSATPPATTRQPPEPALSRLLEFGDLADLEAALRRQSGASDLDGVIARLDDAAQRDAVEHLRRARWAGGDPAEARMRLRAAFAHGARWRAASTPARDPLPPLYPER